LTCFLLPKSSFLDLSLFLLLFSLLELPSFTSFSSLAFNFPFPFSAPFAPNKTKNGLQNPWSSKQTFSHPHTVGSDWGGLSEPFSKPTKHIGNWLPLKTILVVRMPEKTWNKKVKVGFEIHSCKLIFQSSFPSATFISWFIGKLQVCLILW